MFPRFEIGLVLLLLLPTPTIWFSLDHKRNVSDRVVSRIGTLFSPDHKLDASDYDSDSDSDSVASENQPLAVTLDYILSAYRDLPLPPNAQTYCFSCFKMATNKT